jgi:hypothetical protein
MMMLLYCFVEHWQDVVLLDHQLIGEMLWSLIIDFIETDVKCGECLCEIMSE